jgi:hypothetical protein
MAVIRSINVGKSLTDPSKEDDTFLISSEICPEGRAEVRSVTEIQINIATSQMNESATIERLIT